MAAKQSSLTWSLGAAGKQTSRGVRVVAIGREFEPVTQRCVGGPGAAALSPSGNITGASGLAAIPDAQGQGGN